MARKTRGRISAAGMRYLDVTVRVDKEIALRHALRKAEENLRVARYRVEHVGQVWTSGSADRPSYNREHVERQFEAATKAHAQAVHDLELWQQGAYPGQPGSKIKRRELGLRVRLDEDPAARPIPTPGNKPDPVTITGPTGELDLPITPPPASLPTEDTRAAYRRLVARVEAREAGTYGVRVTRPANRPQRIVAAREAVRLRCGARCENPECGGQPDDIDDAGNAILDVDHIQDLTAGGRDHPVQMIALCPNCHALKGRGRNREALRTVLFEVARRAHTLWAEGHTTDRV